MAGKRRFASAVFLLVLLTAPTLADEEQEREAERRAKKAVATFRKAFRCRNEKVRCDALLDLSQTRHALVVKEMGRVLARERSDVVREACAMVLGDMKEVSKEAGALLAAQVREKRNAGAKEFLRAAADSIGSLKYEGAHEELLVLLDHPDQWVVIAAIRAIGAVGDRRALPKLYEMAAYLGTYYDQETREAVGQPRPMREGDRRTAAWKAKVGQSKRVYADIVKLYMRHLRETVKSLTGKEFRTLAEFETWLEEHAEEVGPSPETDGDRR